MLLLLFLNSVSAAPVGDNNVFKTEGSKEQCDSIETELENIPQRLLGKGSSKNIFVGENRLRYNPDDYYLWVESYDFNNNSTEDLIVIDWQPRASDVYYLAFYNIPDKGYVYTDNQKLRKLLRSTHLQPRHEFGLKPIFPEYFDVEFPDGKIESEYFSGYHEIKPMLYNNDVYIVAEKNVGDISRRLIFKRQYSSENVSLICIF
ncbi:hypothetical protein C9I91_11475 [Photobacterium jeanii]|nr:hypothetical protein C9I91_11475 [Photobacterium jeanii]